MHLPMSPPSDTFPAGLNEPNYHIVLHTVLLPSSFVRSNLPTPFCFQVLPVNYGDIFHPERARSRATYGVGIAP
jgi:hypothetical protein